MSIYGDSYLDEKEYGITYTVGDWMQSEGYSDDYPDTAYVYCVCAIAYNDKDEVTDYEKDFGEFETQSEAYDKYEEISDDEFEFPDGIKYWILQIEECKETDSALTCVDVIDEYTIWRKEEKITVVVVEPGEEPYTKVIDNTLESLQHEVDGYIEMLTTDYNRNLYLVVNEEGKIQRKTINRVYYYDGDIVDVICGTFFVTARSNSGNNESLTEEQIKETMERYAIPETFFMRNGKLCVDNGKEAKYCFM